jgi:hypothetical protein
VTRTDWTHGAVEASLNIEYLNILFSDFLVFNNKVGKMVE